MKEAGGGAGKTGREWDLPPHTPGVSPRSYDCPGWDPSAPYITHPGLRPPPRQPGSLPETIA